MLRIKKWSHKVSPRKGYALSNEHSAVFEQELQEVLHQQWDNKMQLEHSQANQQ